MTMTALCKSDGVEEVGLTAWKVRGGIGKGVGQSTRYPSV